MRADRRVRRGELPGRLARRRSSPSWSADAPGRDLLGDRSRCRTRRAGARTPNATGSCCSICRAIPKAPASVSQTALRGRRAHAARRPRRSAPGLPGAHRASSSARTGRTSPQCSADGTCPPIAAPNGEQRTYEAFAAQQRRRVPRRRAHGRAGRTTRRRADVACTARPVVTGGRRRRRRARASRASTRTRPAAIEISSPAGETRAASRCGRNQTSIDVPSYRVGHEHVHARSPSPRSRASICRPGSAAARPAPRRPCGRQRHRRPARPALALSSASNGDGTSTVTARGRAGSGGDGSRLRYGIVREGQRCTPTRRRRRPRPSPGLADGDEYRFTLCVESWFDDDVFGVVDDDRRACAPSRSARRRSGYTFVVDGAPNVGGRTGGVDHPRAADRRPSAFPTATASSSPAGRARSSAATPASRCATCTRSGGRRPRGRPSTPRAGSAPVPGAGAAGACRAASADRTSSRSGDSSTTPPAARRRSRSATPACATTTAPARCCRTRAGTWAVPVGAVRVEGITRRR